MKQAPTSALERRAAESAQAALAGIGTVLGVIVRNPTDLTPILEEIAARAVEVCRAEYGFFYLRDGDLLRFAAASGGSPEQWAFEREHPSPVGRETAVGRVGMDRRIVHIPDVYADTDFRWPEGQRLGGYRTLLAIPIVAEGTLLGAIGMARSAVRPFDDQEIELVTLFGDQAAVAIRISQLLAHEHEAAEREAAVSDVVQVVASSSFDLQQVLQTILERAVQLCQAETGNVARQDGDVFRVVAFIGISAEYKRAERELVYRPERGSLLGRTLLERRVVEIPDVLEDPEYRLKDLQKIGGYRTMLAVPMIRDGIAIGVISVARFKVRPFSARDTRVLETFAGQAAIAIQIATLFQTVERQRTELARFAPQVASLLTSDEGEQLLAGHRRQITALFCDIRGFTAFAETAEPEDVLGVIREYHGAVGELAVAKGGTVEHFAGDGLMVFFNDPVLVPNHQLAAVQTAIAMRDRFSSLATEWRKHGYELGLGIGVATGYATLGRIGFEGRYDYGAIGNVVILASRLSDAAQPGEILVSQREYAAVEEEVQVEKVADLELKGFSRPVPAFRVLGPSA